jgi:hypothetical protein
MKKETVTVEESHFAAPAAVEYPYNVWLDGAWFHLVTGDNVVEIGQEITVTYDPQDQFAHIISTEPLEDEDEVKLINKIYDVLGSQRFADWYGDDGMFGMHVSGDFLPGTATIPTKEQILERIKKDFLP